MSVSPHITICFSADMSLLVMFLVDRPIIVKKEVGSDILMTGFVGNLRNGIIEVIIYNDSLNVEETLKIEPPDPNKIVIERTLTAKILLDPVMALQFGNWLKGQVQIFENMYGKLNIPEGPQREPATEVAELKKEQAVDKEKKPLKNR